MIFRRGDVWSYRRVVRLPTGARVRIRGNAGRYNLSNTKAAAIEAERRHVEEIAAQGATASTGSAVTLAAFAPVFVEHSTALNKSSTVDSKRQILRTHIIPALGSSPIAGIEYATIEDFKHSLASKGLENKTINNVLTVLRRCLAVACKRGLIKAVPEIEWLKVEKQDFDFLDYPEADRLATAADGEWRAMIGVGLKTGMRQSELLALRWEDIDLKAGRIVVRRALVRGKFGPPKNGKPREIPLGDIAISTLQSQRHLRGELVFCDEGGNWLTKAECKWPLWRACKRAGLRRIGWHVLRHTFASHLAMRGAPLKAIQELMGHATIQMTMRYAHLSPQVARDAVRLLDEKSS